MFSDAVNRLRSRLPWLRDVLVCRGVDRKFAANTGWALAGQGVAVGASLAETFLLARFLEVSVFGMFLVLVAATELVFGLLDCRSGEAVIKFLPELKKSAGPAAVGGLMRTIITVDTTLGVLALGVVWCVGRFFGQHVSLPDGQAGLTLFLAAGFLIRTTMNSAGSYLRVTKAFPLAVQVGMLTALVRVIVCAIVVLSRPTLHGVCLVVAGSEGLLGLSLLTTLLWRMKRDRVSLLGPFPGLSVTTLRPIATFLFQTNLALTVRVLAKKADVLVIAALSSTNVVAMYKIAMRIAASLLLFSDPLVTVVFPTLSKLHAERRHSDIRRLTGLLTLVFSLAAACLLLGFGLIGRGLLGTLLGSDYMAAFPTAFLMLAGFSLSMQFFWTRPLLLVYGLTLKVLNAGLVAVALQFVLLALLVPRFGAVGGATAVAAYQLTVVAMYLVAVRAHQRRRAFRLAVCDDSPLDTATAP